MGRIKPHSKVVVTDSLELDSEDEVTRKNPFLGRGQSLDLDERAKTASLAGAGGKTDSDIDSLDEFAMNNSDLFQAAPQDKSRKTHAKVKHEATGGAAGAMSLPSAKTLLGGQSVVARGRHENFGRASASPSTSSLGSSRSDSRFGSRSVGSISPSSPRRTQGNKLTPGLKGENRNGRGRRRTGSNASSSRSPSLSPQISRS